MCTYDGYENSTRGCRICVVTMAALTKPGPHIWHPRVVFLHTHIMTDYFSITPRLWLIQPGGGITEDTSSRWTHGICFTYMAKIFFHKKVYFACYFFWKLSHRLRLYIKPFMLYTIHTQGNNTCHLFSFHRNLTIASHFQIILRLAFTFPRNLT